MTEGDESACGAADERQLRARGLRLTRQRRAVVDVVFSAGRSLAVAEVHERALKRCPGVGLMTVYRTLNLLADIGAVRRVHTADRCEEYGPAAFGHGHTVLCSECGAVSEFTRCELGEIANAAASETGYRISGHFLQFAGVCAACRIAERGERQHA